MAITTNIYDPANIHTIKFSAKRVALENDKIRYERLSDHFVKIGRAWISKEDIKEAEHKKLKDKFPLLVNL